MAVSDSAIEREPDNSSQEFIDRFAAKFEAEDAAADRAASGDEGAESEDELNGAPSDDVTTGEDPAEDTPTADPDGDAGESDPDSPASDDDEDPEGDAPEDSPTTPSDDDDEEAPVDPDDDTPEGDADEDPISQELADFAKTANIPLSIDDVPDGPAREIVKKKIRDMDSAFTRVMQQATTFRKEEVAFRAEQAYRAQHPELAIIEAFEADPSIVDKVIDLQDKLGDATQKKALTIVIEDAKKQSRTQVEASIRAAEERYERASHVETFAKSLAKKANLPWHFAESAVERELLRRANKNPDADPDLTDDEVVGLVTETAKQYGGHVRAHRREASKKIIQDRTANRKATPGSKTPATAASPKPAPSSKKAKMNHNSEEWRLSKGMEVAKRLFPGARDE